MRPNVFVQVVAASELLVADGTGESLVTGMRPHVALKFVGAGEALPAEQPIADEWTFTCVPVQVSLQVRCLAVDLAAARDVAAVLVQLAYLFASDAPDAICLLAVRTFARRSRRYRCGARPPAKWRYSMTQAAGQRRDTSACEARRAGHTANDEASLEVRHVGSGRMVDRFVWILEEGRRPESGFFRRLKSHREIIHSVEPRCHVVRRRVKLIGCRTHPWNLPEPVPGRNRPTSVVPVNPRRCEAHIPGDLNRREGRPAGTEA